jgi:hypothetical protein
LRKWIDARHLLGCAVFVDLLVPCAIFSKSMQRDELDILGALNCLLRAVKETKVEFKIFRPVANICSYNKKHIH